MSTEQRESAEAVLRRSAFPIGSEVKEQRRLLRKLASAQLLPAGVTVTAGALGGVLTTRSADRRLRMRLFGRLITSSAFRPSWDACRTPALPRSSPNSKNAPRAGQRYQTPPPPLTAFDEPQEQMIECRVIAAESARNSRRGQRAGDPPMVAPFRVVLPGG